MEKEGNENTGLTFSEFMDMWAKAEKLGDCTVIDTNETKIKADSYSVYWNNDNDSLIILYYHNYKIAEINLKYIKSIY